MVLLSSCFFTIILYYSLSVYFHIQLFQSVRLFFFNFGDYIYISGLWYNITVMFCFLMNASGFEILILNQRCVIIASTMQPPLHKAIDV